MRVVLSGTGQFVHHVGSWPARIRNVYSFPIAYRAVIATVTQVPTRSRSPRSGRVTSIDRVLAGFFLRHTLLAHRVGVASTV
jgi:hypothetical protein